MQELFGEWANDVTVRQLMYMKSGIQDFETLGIIDHGYLEPNVSNKVHDPIDLLKFVSLLPEKSPCLTWNCTWVYEPGTHCSYSSTNYELMGYILLAFMPDGQNDSWDQLDLNFFLGLDFDVYQHTFFPPKGKLNEVGLTMAGTSTQYGKAEIWE